MSQFSVDTLRRPSREEKILAGLNLSGQGLEIGASINPLIRPEMGIKCKVMDHLDQSGLISKYREINHAGADSIGYVDYVWSGQPYTQLVGNDRFDWIVASHVIEHIPDLIGFIKECSSILTETGVLSLVVPDKRYTFDALRPTTGLSQIIDSHLAGLSRPSAGTIGEFCLYATNKDGTNVWDDRSPGGSYAFVGDIPGIMDMMMSVHKGEYRDVHVGVFTPAGFRLIIENLFQLGMIDMREEAFFETEGCEFFVRLSRTGAGPGLSRIALAQIAAREIC